MTAPDSFSPAPGDTQVHGRETLRVRIDGALDVAALSLLAARDWGLAAGRGLSLVLDTGGEPGSGLAALKEGGCDLLLARPLCLLEHPAQGCEVIGCLLETRGGVLVREDRLSKLRMGELLRVASLLRSAAGDRLCRLILQRWAGNQGFAVAETRIAVDPAETPSGPAAGAAAADPAAMLQDADAVWPAYANAHEVMARALGVPVRLVSAEEAGLASFAAVGLMARERRSPAETARFGILLELLEAAAGRLASDPAAALGLWRAASGEDGDGTAAVVAATAPLLKQRIDRRPVHWRLFEDLLHETWSPAA